MENFRRKFKLMRRRMSIFFSNLQCHNNMHGCLRQSDVLICIFKYLPSSDRKNVRLTCKLWSEVCSTSSITKGQKLVFRPNCSISEIADLLRNLTSERNLEFQNQPIATIPHDVWKICGSRIRGLHFYHCHHFDQHCLRMVIEHCENLSDINIDESGSPLHCATLDYFIERKIKREMLSSFSLRYAKDEHLDADLLRRIFIVFPKIQNFTTGNACDTPIPDFKDVETSVPPESLTQLKSLVYLHSECFNGEHWLHAPMIPISTFRLKKFETTLNHHGTTKYMNSLKKTLFEFIEAQEELEIINLRKASGSERFRSEEWPLFIKELIFRVLDRCRNLREFRLADPSEILLTEKETAHFFTRVAELKCLAIDVHIFRIQRQFAFLSERASYFVIDTLSVRGGKRDTEEFMACILAQCSPKHLRMRPISDEFFEKIITTYERDLCTLVLDDVCENYVNWSCLFLITPHEIQFRHLKHLKIDMNCTPGNLYQLARHIPAVEVLELDAFFLCKWKVIIRVCSLLRNLRRLSVYYVKEFRLKELLQLFHVCPNLRCVIQIRTNEVFLFNPFTKEISECSLTDDVRFPEIEDIFHG